MNIHGNRRGMRLALAAALVLALGACQVASTPRGEVAGTVVNRKGGTSVAGTTVRAVEFEHLTTTTAADGSYALELPEGTWTLEFTQDGYATSRVEGVVVVPDETVRQDVIQSEAFDPAVPTEAPTVTVSLSDGDTVTGDADTDAFTFDIDVAVADPELLQPYFVTAALGQSRGTSGYLNQFVPGQIVGLGEASVTATLSAAGFEGPTTLHVVAYDTNFNRTERIVHLEVLSSGVGAAPVAPTDLAATAVTFGDVGVFGGLGVPPQVTGMQLLEALVENDLGRLAPTATSAPTAFSEVDPYAAATPQGYLDEVVTWVDLTFVYDVPSADDYPSAFEVFRSLGGGDFELLGRVSASLAHLGGSTFGYRDATPSVRAGVEATYRVDAVTDGDRAESGTFSVTPLGPFTVTADDPDNGETFTSVLPTYAMSYTGTADDVYVGVLVFDRVHAEDNFLEWGIVDLDLSFDGLAPGLTVTESGATIPHNVDGSAATDVLQAFHAYDWTPIAVTYTSDLSAISVASDFYDFFGVGFGVSDGPWNTFLTGDGSF